MYVRYFEYYLKISINWYIWLFLCLWQTMFLAEPMGCHCQATESWRVTDLPKGSGRRCPWQRAKSLAGTPVVGMGTVCRTIWPGKAKNDVVDSVDGSSSKSTILFWGSMCSSTLCWLRKTTWQKSLLHSWLNPSVCCRMSFLESHDPKFAQFSSLRFEGSSYSC